MKNIILDKLAHIEKEHSIRILFACESGSRGWGFPSPDSDYDVRFIYIRNLSEYLSVKTIKDSMDFPIDKELDINGWDLRKALNLLTKSNVSPFEWLQSPIIYFQEDHFAEEMKQLTDSYFCPCVHVRHYLGIVKIAMNQIENDQINIKKTILYIASPTGSAVGH